MKRAGLVALLLVVLAGVAASFTACSPIYVVRAGIAEAKILAARRPIPDVILDPATDPETRGKLTLAREARRFIEDSLQLRVGDSYTTYTELDRDTLAMVLSAAYRTKLASKTWWFPVVGHLPYRGYFSLESAQKEQAKLEREGLDTYLRPTSAFSTLGWFSDPLLSTIVRYDHVTLVETIIHELSHNHLFVSGHVQFNESFATFVGSAGAIRFFCGRPGGGSDTVKCQRAQARWRDQIRFSRFLDPIVAEVQTLYERPEADSVAVLTEREAVFVRGKERFRATVAPTFEVSTFASFESLPLNNATLLARMRYYHRLADFQAYLDIYEGDLAAAVAALSEGVGSVLDPFELLPKNAAPLP